MGQSKHTKKALLASVLSVVACCALLIGSTFAWFTDEVTSGNNRIVAGNLDVELEYTTDGKAWSSVHEGTNLFREDTLWEPGHMEVAYLKVANRGTLALKYQLGMNAVDSVISTNVAGQELRLSEHLKYAVVELTATEGAITPYTRETAVQALENATEYALNVPYQDGGVMYPATAANAEHPAERYLALIVYMPEKVGNEANYLTDEKVSAPEISLGVSLFATQTPYEADSFDNTYDQAAEEDALAGVSISGIAGLEGQVFATVQEAYAAGNKIVATLGLGQEAASDDAFDAIYTDGGKITWTIYGAQTLENNKRILTFGRASNRYSSTRSIQEINIVGGNESARLFLQSVGLPYAWWNYKEDALTINFKQLGLTGAGDGTISCSRAYGVPLRVTFDQCDVTGRIYHYFNGEGAISITNCHFTNNGTIGYAFHVQGSVTEPLTVTFSNNTVTGYTRGINIEQRTAKVTVQNNTITSTYSEPDRGAIQLTDAATCLVDNNTIRVNGGNAIWFHSAAKNPNVQYTITNNHIVAPYLINDDTTFGIAGHIISSGNTVEVEYPGFCMEKEAAEATPCDITLH